LKPKSCNILYIPEATEVIQAGSEHPQHFARQSKLRNVRYTGAHCDGNFLNSQLHEDQIVNK
jgi:hypothetical protein